MGRTKSRVVAMIGAALAMGGCEGFDGGSSAEVTDSAGITIVDNGALSGTWEEGEGWTVRTVLEIGGDESREETIFGRVADVDVDSRGRIYVLDGFARAVRVFDPEGTYLTTLGGPEEGPGQIGQFPEDLMVQEGDTILAPDPGRNHQVRFLPDGTVLPSRPFPAGPAYRTRWDRGPDALYVRQLRRFVRESGRWGGEDVLVRTDGVEGLDTLLTFQYPDADLGGPEVGTRVPLIVPGPSWTVLPDGGVAWSSFDKRRVWIHAPDGSLERLVARDAWAPRPVTAEDVDVLKDLLAEKLSPYGLDRTAIDGMDVPEPEALPGIAAVASLPDGTLLVQRGGPAEDVEPWALNASDHPGAFGGPIWDVLDPEGFYLGSVTFPERFRLLRATDDALYGVRRDELGTPLVVKLVLDRG